MKEKEQLMQYKFELITKDQIILIQSLWEKLNEIHLIDSLNFKDHFRNYTFSRRCEKFNLIDDDNIRIETAVSDGNIIGYCISTIAENNGEIDSVFIEKKFRNCGVGDRLIKSSIHWLKERECGKISVAVADGHESVFGFYQKYGFYPRLTYLQMK
jgi:ribosomal protein S18 acetylase RimI-like enzyme